MTANEFVWKFGWEEASEIVAGVPSKYMECYYSTLHWCNRNKKYSDRFKPRIDLVNIADLKRLVETYDLVNELGGFEKAKLHLVATDKHLGYTHVYLHENGRYCWLDDYIDHIPFCAISIDSATKAITDIESVESLKEMT